MERRIVPLRTERIERAKASIAPRLRAVCPHLSEAEFEALVERMAVVQIKYALRVELLQRDS